MKLWKTTEVIKTQQIVKGTLITLTRNGVRSTCDCNGYMIEDYLGSSINEIPEKLLITKGKTIHIYPGKPMMYLDSYKLGASRDERPFGGYVYTAESFDVLIDDIVMPLVFTTSTQYLVPIICKLDCYNLSTDRSDEG